MNRLFPLSLFLMLALATRLQAAPNVLAHSSGNLVWVARVTVSTTAAGTSSERTDILIRQSGPGQQWKELATCPARVTALSSRGTQLVTLLSNGSWQFVWGPGGASTGNPLPAGGQIRAIGDGGDTLWAVGMVKGGLTAATQAANTQPTTDQTVGASHDSAHGAPAAAPSLPPKLVLFQLRSGSWVAIAEFPSDLIVVPAAGVPLPKSEFPAESFVPPDGEVSLAVVGGQPLVAFALSDGSIRTVRFNAEKKWEEVGLVKPLEAGHPPADFELISAENRVLLWTTDGKTPGRLFQDATETPAPIQLKWAGDNAPNSVPAFTAAGGYLRLIGLHDDKLFEQRYETHGTPVGLATELAVPVNLNDSPIQYWVDGALILALLFSVAATMYRRSAQLRTAEKITSPPPAPLLLRAGAGLVDLLPVLITSAVISLYGDPTRDPLQRMQAFPVLVATSIAIAFYLLHTTLAEVFTGRSAGKWIFGLKAVTVGGAPPATGQIIVRNVLRVLDLLWFPLMLVVISPLRQRSGDIAAGTMVIRVEEEIKEPVEEEKDGELNAPDDKAEEPSDA